MKKDNQIIMKIFKEKIMNGEIMRIIINAFVNR